MNGLTVEEMEFLAAKGLSLTDIIEFARLRPDGKPRSANAERQARYRERKKANGVTETVTRNVTRDVTPPSEVSPNDIYSNPLPNSPQNRAAALDGLAEKVVEAWNAGPKAKGAKGCRGLDDSRRKALRARVKEHGEQAVFDAIKNIAESPFHCGKNDRDWSADIGWLLKVPGNFMKILELSEKPKPVSSNADRYAAYRQQAGLQ